MEMTRSSPSVDPSRWFPTPNRSPDASFTLFCLPHAGGDIINFWTWPRLMPLGVELRCAALPGKFGRSSEPAMTTFDAALDMLERTIQPYLDRPYAIFGHSMGALLAFELTRRLQHSARPPLHLFASGMVAPDRYRPEHDLAAMTDSEVIEFLREMNGTPDELLTDPGAMRVILPAVRNDFALCHSYAYVPAARIACPMTVLAGRQDKMGLADVEPWCDAAGAGCRVAWFDGDHMFVKSSAAAVLGVIAAELIPLSLNASAERDLASARDRRTA